MKYRGYKHYNVKKYTRKLSINKIFNSTELQVIKIPISSSLSFEDAVNIIKKINNHYDKKEVIEPVSKSKSIIDKIKNIFK